LKSSAFRRAFTTVPPIILEQARAFVQKGWFLI